ncbi:MAG: hypothetical protein AW09_001544 [Candidatus Accumulibacter phosphatis]|uniref:Uncharacterized protein n=1 Tax=Candidatus Accumulibacter phosphatis TaxID=327160 RepID=A0A080LWQ5_9PROT|nr:MAG: hypothetical protein AW09_001544 [Candidatus Accumulibacter phosphatis]
MHRLRARRTAGDFGFLELAFAGIGQQVERIAGAHDAGARQRECNARGVDGDPAAAPLLSDGRGGARAAGGVEDEVAGVGGHQHAAFDEFGSSLNDVNLVGRRRCVTPRVLELDELRVACEPAEVKVAAK